MFDDGELEQMLSETLYNVKADKATYAMAYDYVNSKKTISTLISEFKEETGRSISKNKFYDMVDMYFPDHRRINPEPLPSVKAGKNLLKALAVLFGGVALYAAMLNQHDTIQERARPEINKTMQDSSAYDASEHFTDSAKEVPK